MEQQLNNNKTTFERQREKFQEFIENARDVFDLKIKDGVKTTFLENSILFDKLIEIESTNNHLIPIIKFHKPIETPDEVLMCRNILNNTSEVTSIFREYLLLRSHMMKFTDLGTSTDELYNQLKHEIMFLQDLETAYFDNHMFFITKDDEYQYFLKVIKYGNAKKTIVDMGYIVKNNETGETTQCYEYQINKSEFPGDLAYQISSQNCSHIKK